MRELAEAHLKADPNTVRIEWFASNNEEIRLLEVSKSSPAIYEVLPYRFKASPENGVEYPSAVIVLSEEEWDQVSQGELPLPPGWDLSISKTIYTRSEEDANVSAA